MMTHEKTAPYFDDPNAVQPQDLPDLFAKLEAQRQRVRLAVERNREIARRCGKVRTAAEDGR